MTYEQYEAVVRQHLTEKRFFHSQCVAEEAVRLAERYGADREQARTAGILHDIMKDTPPEEQLKILGGFGIMLTKTQRANPKLWHALSGAAYLEHTMGVEDRAVLDAVRCHTSGRKDMTALDKVLFVADFISADRDYPGVKKMRKLADRSLEEAMLEGIAFTVGELMELRKPVAPESVDAYNDALSILNEKKES